MPEVLQPVRRANQDLALGSPKSILAENGNGLHVQKALRAPAPPDNLSSIPTCSHLKTVLESKALLTVRSTYHQAVLIAVATNGGLQQNASFTLVKDDTRVLDAKLKEYTRLALCCSLCNDPNFYSVFICLQCPHVGCYKSHAAAHSKAQNHMFAIDSRNGLLFCFVCGTYTSEASLNAIRVSAVLKAIPQNPHEVEGFTKPSLQAALGVKGIVNLGSTCFISCILQTMIHNPLVRNHFFLNDDHYFNCASQPYYDSGDDQITESTACTTCLIDSTFKEFFTSSSTEGYGITNLLTTAWHKNRLLAGFQEQDAHEFWQFLLNEFHLDYERIAHIMGVEANPCKCIMHTVFAGEFESSVACGLCGAVARTVDPLIDLSLEINHANLKLAPTLYDCLDQFTHNEPLDLKYKCRSCRKEARAHRSLKIKTLPPVLSIQLKRFKHNFANDTASKVDDKVDVPLFLDVTKYSSDYDENLPEGYIDGSKVYELFALVNHAGLVNTGHYIALIKTPLGQWLKFDDSVVSYISHEEVKNTNAYLLFYISHHI